MTVRTTVPLKASFTDVRTDLDAPSTFRLQFAQAFLHATGGKLIRPSGVIRRALEVYLDHISALQDPAQEFKRAASASQGSEMNREGRAEASKRFEAALKAAAQGNLPGDFWTLLRGPRAPDMAAALARVEELARFALRPARDPSKKTAPKSAGAPNT